jgi:hypothetical protein
LDFTPTGRLCGRYLAKADSNIPEPPIQNIPPITKPLVVQAVTLPNPKLTKFIIKFDGGTPCNIPPNYGIGYGSYQINDFPIVRVDHRVRMSANSAEILTLVCAIRNVLALEPERSKISLEIWGDSTIAINWANGVTQTGKPCKVSKGSSEEFRNSTQTLRDILKGFPEVRAFWHSRTNSVSTFGH